MFFSRFICVNTNGEVSTMDHASSGPPNIDWQVTHLSTLTVEHITSLTRRKLMICVILHCSFKFQRCAPLGFPLMSGTGLFISWPDPTRNPSTFVQVTIDDCQPCETRAYEALLKNDLSFIIQPIHAKNWHSFSVCTQQINFTRHCHAITLYVGFIFCIFQYFPSLLVLTRAGPKHGRLCSNLVCLTLVWN